MRLVLRQFSLHTFIQTNWALKIGIYIEARIDFFFITDVFVTAAVLGFAHTLGEFGVVLMIGGNIPGVTRVASIAIYDHVESLEYVHAHWLSGALIVLSFVLLAAVYALNRRFRLLQT